VNAKRHRLLFWILLTAAALAVPIVPFLVCGESLETRMADWLALAQSRQAIAALVIGLLASDIFLPVPSSLVSTFAGKALGFWLGTAASWCGMTIGASLGFWLARCLGRPFARRLSSEEELAHTDALANRYGALIVILARPVPVLAEASVLVMGMTRIGWWPFFAAVALSNAGVAAAYAALGDRAQLPVAIVASLLVPLAFVAIARWLWPSAKDKVS
jgi:uncharacterized membrane protein YdjX (TVP38/TMEM64 family)